MTKGNEAKRSLDPSASEVVLSWRPDIPLLTIESGSSGEGSIATLNRADPVTPPLDLPPLDLPGLVLRNSGLSSHRLTPPEMDAGSIDLPLVAPPLADGDCDSSLTHRSESKQSQPDRPQRPGLGLPILPSSLPPQFLLGLAIWMGLAAIALFFSQTFSRTSRFEFVQPSSHTLGTVLQQNYEHKRNRVAAALESGELEASTARTGTIVHEVKSGESLWQLAKQYKMEAAAIAASNQIAPDTQLKTGQKLYLPRAEGLLYTVQPGDTLEGIAADFGVNRAAIIRTTPLKNAGYLRVGQKLVLPGKVDDLLVTRQQLLADRASWTAQPQVGVIGLPSAAPVASVQTYTVNPGDTLEAIANRFGITQTQLLSANPGLNPDFLSVGQSLTIPTKVASGVGTPTAAAVQTYTVTAGDTLGEIASRFGVSQQSLIAANPGVIPSQIEVGQQLTVPPADSASAAISLSGSVATPATLLASGFVMPTSGTFTSGFGWRWGRMHNGIDIAGPVGTPVHAAQSGTVVYAGYHLGGYGYLVKILHPNGLMTLYAHGYGIYVSQGQTVSQGQVIMSRGNTGWSTGPHLHFEVHINDVPVDPSPYLR